MLTPRLVTPLGPWPPMEWPSRKNEWRRNKVATDPAYKARLSADKAKYRESLKEDPIKYAHYLEQKRLSYHRCKQKKEQGSEGHPQ
jgi:hypothetical protein